MVNFTTLSFGIGLLFAGSAIFAGGACSSKPASPAEIARAEKEQLIHRAFQSGQAFIARGFDFPVGPPDARKYYSAQNFGDNGHLGEDWNRRGGGDLGDPVFAMAHGVVVFAADHGGGWGNIVRVVHRLPDGTHLESLYAHLHVMTVKKGRAVRKGEKIGTIGSAGGQYSPHLHLEMRRDIHLPIGGGYGRRGDMRGFLAPMPLILANRRVERSLKLFPIPDSRGPTEDAQRQIASGRAWKRDYVRSALKPAGDVNARDAHGRTALHCAADLGFTTSARRLLKRGARLDTRDHYGYTPAMRARFAFRSPPSIRRLLPIADR